MNLFDIIGPIMVGPSSSHTAGAARIGSVTRKLLGEKPVTAAIKLHGSFAHTYKGHGTDKAIIGGLLGMNVDDPNLSNSIFLAEKEGLNFSIQPIDLGEVHPNTVLIEAEGISGKEVSVLASSVGGGNIVILQVNGIAVDFTCQFFTLIVPHTDAPGVVAKVTNILADNLINIAAMKLFRTYRGGSAMMIIETDNVISKLIADKIRVLSKIDDVIVIEPV